MLNPKVNEVGDKQSPQFANAVTKSMLVGRGGVPPWDHEEACNWCSMPMHSKIIRKLCRQTPVAVEDKFGHSGRCHTMCILLEIRKLDEVSLAKPGCTG